MAIYHLNMSYYSRAKGDSSVAASAYRRGERLTDKRIGKIWDYTDRQDVKYSKFHIPQNAPKWIYDIVDLEKDNPRKMAENFWNLVEETEKRKDAKLAYEFDVALPKELTLKQNIALVEAFVKEELCADGMLADVNIHWKDGNPHVHVLCSTREILESGFSNKVIAWERKKFLYDVRKGWANHANAHLALHNKEVRIDHRSYREQGINFTPTAHEGYYAGKLHEETKRSRIVQENISIAQHNCSVAFDHPEEIIKEVAAQKAVFTEKDLLSVAHKRLLGNEELIAEIMPRMLKDKTIQCVGENVKKEKCYATLAYIETEKSLYEIVDILHSKKPHSVDTEIVERLLAEKYAFLSEEQKNAVRHVCGGESISCVVGKPGTGKTVLMQAVSDAHKKAGYRVLGMGLAGKAAENLGKEVNIEASTIASYVKAWESYKEAVERQELLINPQEKARNLKLIESLRKYQLGQKDVVILDEAGMVDTQLFHKVLTAIKYSGAKNISLGDSNQLAAISSGDAYRGIVQQIGAAKLHDIRRQKVTWMKEASGHFSELNIRDGLEAYEKHERIKWVELDSLCAKQIVKDYFLDQKKHGVSITNQLILSYTNKNVDLLNDAVRRELKTRGRLGQVETIINGQYYTNNDRIVFLKNDNQGRLIKTIEGNGKGIKNGTLGTILDITKRNIKAKLDDGRSITFSLDDYHHFQHGYAVTEHKGQGATIDRTYVWVSRHMDAQATNVAMTRHKEDVNVYISQEEFRDFKYLTEVVGRSNQKELVLDYSIDQKNQSHYDNVRIYLDLHNDATMLLAEIKKRYSLSKDDKEIWEDEQWGAFITSKKERNNLAITIVDNWEKHKIFARQAHISKEYLEVQLGNRARMLSEAEKKARRTMEEYVDTQTKARNLWNEIKKTHPGSLCYQHDKYELFDNIRKERDSIAHLMVEQASMHKQFAKENKVKWDIVCKQANAFGLKAKAVTEFNNLTSTNQQRYYLVEQYKQYCSDSSTIWHHVKPNKTDRIATSSDLISIEAFQKAQAKRNETAYQIVQEIAANQQFLNWHDVKENNLYKHAYIHQAETIIANYQSSAEESVKKEYQKYIGHWLAYEKGRGLFLVANALKSQGISPAEFKVNSLLTEEHLNQVKELTYNLTDKQLVINETLIGIQGQQIIDKVQQYKKDREEILAQFKPLANQYTPQKLGEQEEFHQWRSKWAGITAKGNYLEKKHPSVIKDYNLTDNLKNDQKQNFILNHFLGNPKPISQQYIRNSATKSNVANKKIKWWDADKLQEALIAELPQFVEYLKGEPNRRLSNSRALVYGNKGSFKIDVSGEMAGRWHDFENDVGGHIFKLIQHERSVDFKEALELAGNYLNMEPEVKSFASLAKETNVVKEKAKETVFTKEQLTRINKTKELINKSRPLIKGPATQYLANRGIKELYQADLRFNENVWERETKTEMPALICIARDENENVQGVQRIYLTPDGKKAPIQDQKMSMGVIKGASVFIQNGSSDYIALAEGIETALSIAQAKPEWSVYATLGVSNMGNFEPKESNQKIIICADNDGEKAGSNKTVQKAALGLALKGHDVYYVQASDIEGMEKTDFNDVLTKKGADVIKVNLDNVQLLEKAYSLTSTISEIEKNAEQSQRTEKTSAPTISSNKEASLEEFIEIHNFTHQKMYQLAQTDNEPKPEELIDFYHNLVHTTQLKVPENQMDFGVMEEYAWEQDVEKYIQITAQLIQQSPKAWQHATDKHLANKINLHANFAMLKEEELVSAYFKLHEQHKEKQSNIKARGTQTKLGIVANAVINNPKLKQQIEQTKHFKELQNIALSHKTSQECSVKYSMEMALEIEHEREISY